VLRDIFRFLGVDDEFRPSVRTRHNVSGRPKSRHLQRLFTRRHPAKDAVKVVVRGHRGQRLIAWLQTLNLERPGLPTEIRAGLVDGYREDIHHLEDLIGRDLSHWLQ
jgi:hypothetical protein